MGLKLTSMCEVLTLLWPQGDMRVHSRIEESYSLRKYNGLLYIFLAHIPVPKEQADPRSRTLIGIFYRCSNRTKIINSVRTRHVDDPTNAASSRIICSLEKIAGVDFRVRSRRASTAAASVTRISPALGRDHTSRAEGRNGARVRSSEG